LFSIVFFPFIIPLDKVFDIQFSEHPELYKEDLNFNFFIYSKLWLGVFFRSAYGSGFLMQYYITNKFRVAYSFDSGARDARRLGASHEVMIGFDFSGTKSKMLNPRFL